MNPYDEQRIRDEVIYLHSLWHQGPPQQSQPLLHRYPFTPSHTRSLPPVPSTAFKKNRKNKKKKEPKPDSSVWSRPHSSNSPQTGWPVPKPRSDPPPPPLQPQEKERLSALQAHNKACKALREFLSGFGSDDEEDTDNDNDDDESDGRLKEYEEFFIRVFMEDNELMRYYQRCFENGEFCCFVCGAAEIKSWKKYKDCIGLVQHSISILRTGNKKAHRAFGQAVCKVLGWDIHRLPTIVITGEPLRCSIEGSPKKSVAANDDGKDGSSKTEDIAVSLEHVEDSVEVPPLPPPPPPPPPLQPQEKERLSASQTQNKACKALREFLSGSGSDNEEDDNDEEDDDDDSDGRLVEFEEFFIRVFMEDNELMGYYQRCFENGEFCCLVCGAGKKSGKKYKDCIGLVQHSISILRTGNKKAHRAFGQAVCKVLGWDIHRLPTIVITGEPLRCPTEGNPKKSVADNKDGKDGSSKTKDIAVSLEHVEDSIEEHVKGADQSIAECSSKESDIDAKVVDIKEKAVSLAHDDEPVEDHERGVDQSISEVMNL